MESITLRLLVIIKTHNYRLLYDYLKKLSITINHDYRLRLPQLWGQHSMISSDWVASKTIFTDVVMLTITTCPCFTMDRPERSGSVVE